MPTQHPLQKFLAFSLPRWKDLPDYEIYNEQLVLYVNRILFPLLETDRVLTPTMVQNYVKWKCLPRPEGKKYDRNHIARCIVITLLKKVLTIPEIEQGIRLQQRLLDTPQAYDFFCRRFEMTLAQCFSPLYRSNGSEDYAFPGFEVPPDLLAIHSVCLSLTYKLLTERVLRYDGFAHNRERFLFGSATQEDSL